MREFGSRVGVTHGCVDTQIASNPFEPEDSHAVLLAGLAVEPAYDLVQLDPINDPDFIGLVIGGRLRATYRKVDVYAPTSMVAKTILDRTRAQAVRANTIVRNLNRCAYGSVAGGAAAGVGQLSRGMEQKPGSWEATEFTTPPLSDGSQSAHGEERVERTTETLTITNSQDEVVGHAMIEEPIVVPASDEEPLFDMGRAKVLDDDEISDTLPSFFGSVTGLARKHEVDEDDEQI